MPHQVLLVVMATTKEFREERRPDARDTPTPNYSPSRLHPSECWLTRAACDILAAKPRLVETPLDHL